MPIDLNWIHHPKVIDSLLSLVGGTLVLLGLRLTVKWMGLSDSVKGRLLPSIWFCYFMFLMLSGFFIWNDVIVFNDWIENTRIVHTFKMFAGATVLLFAMRTGVRWAGLSVEHKRKLLRALTLVYVFFLVVIAYGIWVNELRDILVAMTAFTVAFVLAGKELILCFSGYMYRLLGNAYARGDRIQIGDIRGDVVDVRFLSSTLMEVDKETNQSTGRLVTLPHSMFLSLPVYNSTPNEGFLWLEVIVQVEKTENLLDAKRILEEVANELKGNYEKTIVRRISDLQDEFNVKMPRLTPKVYLSEKDGKPRLNLRIAIPPRTSRDVADQVLWSYQQAFQAYLKQKELEREKADAECPSASKNTG